MFLREKKILLREVFRADILEYDTGIGEYRLQGLVVIRMKIMETAVTFRRQNRTGAYAGRSRSRLAGNVESCLAALLSWMSRSLS